MMDMLVRLYDLPDIEEDLRRLEREGFLIRRPGAYERHLVADWVGRNFSPKWVSEAKVAFWPPAHFLLYCHTGEEDSWFCLLRCNGSRFFGPHGSGGRGAQKRIRHRAIGFRPERFAGAGVCIRCHRRGWSG